MLNGINSAPMSGSNSRVSIPVLCGAMPGCEFAVASRYPEHQKRTSSPGNVLVGSLCGPVAAAGHYLTPRHYEGSVTAPSTPTCAMQAYDLYLAASRGKAVSPAPSPTPAQRLLSMPTPVMSSMPPPLTVKPVPIIEAVMPRPAPVSTPVVSNIAQPTLQPASNALVEIIATQTPRHSLVTSWPAPVVNQATFPMATVGLDTNLDGKANVYLTGLDRNRDGIPDVLQRQQADFLSVMSTPARMLTGPPSMASPPSTANGSIRAALYDQNATIQELERRLAQSTIELAERESRIAELTRKNERLQNITHGLAPVVKAKGKGKRSASRPDSAERDRSSIFSVRTREDDEEDDIDVAVKQYLAERPDLQVSMTKVRKGWYMVKPLGKKVFLKRAGKDKLVVRVGGGHVSFEKFIADFAPAVNQRSRESSVRRSTSC